MVRGRILALSVNLRAGPATSLGVAPEEAFTAYAVVASVTPAR